MKMGYLLLQDGTIFKGKSMGAGGVAMGGAVINTGMANYEGVLTSKLNRGLIVCQTYPVIGGFGVNMAGFEHTKPCVAGYVVKNLSTVYSNHNAKQSILDYLTENNVVCLAGVDTRALARHIREHGEQNAAIVCVQEADNAKLLAQLAGLENNIEPEKCESKGGGRVAVMDFGQTAGVIALLEKAGVKCATVSPYAKANDLAGFGGVVLSAGPGDPNKFGDIIKNVEQIINTLPVLGIGIGCRLLALACGGTVVKMKQGHRGCSYPVAYKGKTFATAQNHGYVIEKPGSGMSVAYKNANDGTTEGIEHDSKPVFGVEFELNGDFPLKEEKDIIDRFCTSLLK